MAAGPTSFAGPALPFDDASADPFLFYSGLHVVNDPWRHPGHLPLSAPDAKVIGTTFLSDASRRAEAPFAAGNRTGHAYSCIAEISGSWLRSADLVDVNVGTQPGLVVFSASREFAGSVPASRPLWLLRASSASEIQSAAVAMPRVAAQPPPLAGADATP